MGRRWAPGICAVALLWLAAAAAGDPDPDELERAFPIVEPDYGHTKLRLSEQGLEAIRRIENPIAIVGVIGPYRSGKSFLLNQLLSLSCDKGRCCLAPPSISHGFNEMHSRTNNK
uniref:GB1/RHD3-type G domain-containing protein n=1 Tax=Aegilops tauschii subsp. strangulata TaxID=200361 RepID=A0A453M2G9_AEGTS